MILLYIFAYIGIYTTIATIWRSYEQLKYKELRPNNDDTIICFIISYLLLVVMDNFI
jgi:accessory gene regulator protein AgrB